MISIIKNPFLLIVLFALWNEPGRAQTPDKLPRSTPEAEGVSSKAISIFLDSIAASKHEFHSLMILRHGKVIAEGWWKPYRANLKHTLYSLSKSFTATAVGFAQSEGKLSISDKVVSFFPNQLPDTVSDYLQQLTIKDLLTMSVGQDPEPIGVIMDTNWVRGFLAAPIKYEPGTRFLYNSVATYILSAIVQKTTGEKILDYLQPRLFDPLGIDKPDWETDPAGINTGGWGLRLKTEDIAKFAQVFLQKGKWNGKQLLPAGWAEEASAAHIIQHPEYSQAKRDSSDWEQGYGYQMWRCRNNAFRGDGAFGQYAIVMPEQDVVIAITSETADMQGELNLIWKLLLPAMKTDALPRDKKAESDLQKKLSRLALPIKIDNKRSAPASWKSEKTFAMAPNDLRIQSLSFRFTNNTSEMTVRTESTRHKFQFGLNDWQHAETRDAGPYLVERAKNNLAGLPDFKIAGEYSWIDDNTLELVLRYIESPHSERYLCRVNGNEITVEVKRSFFGEASGNTVVMTGKME